MAVSDGHITAIETKMRLRERPLSELTEEMEKLSSDSDRDVDLLCAYLDVLEEKAPVSPAGHEPAAEYKKFKEAHVELFDPPEAETAEKPVSRKRRWFPFRQLLTSFAAIFCLLILVAEASGAGIVGRLIEWGGEIFSLRPASGVMELKTADENGFRSLQDALDHYGEEDAAIPTWIPKRYSIDRVSTLEGNDSTIISGKFLSGEDTLLIRTTIAYNETFTFEEEQADEHTVYESNGISFILSSNTKTERATWTIDNCTYSVSGAVTKSELTQMLDSIPIKE